jgi:hypothetical protein
VDEQSDQGKSVGLQCRFCGNTAGDADRRSREEYAQRYQVIIACAQCGNEFAAISRN